MLFIFTGVVLSVVVETRIRSYFRYAYIRRQMLMAVVMLMQVLVVEFFVFRFQRIKSCFIQAAVLDLVLLRRIRSYFISVQRNVSDNVVLIRRALTKRAAALGVSLFSLEHLRRASRGGHEFVVACRAICLFFICLRFCDGLGPILADTDSNTFLF